MAYVIKFTQTRPNLIVPFYGEILGQAFKDYFATNYTDTGKFIAKELEVSPNGLKITVTHTWVSKEAYDSYMADPWIIENFLTPSIAYRTDNNIIQRELSAKTVA